jgi:hypothetical protein
MRGCNRASTNLEMRSADSRHGITLQEVIIAVLLLTLLGTILAPAAVALRERSRLASCQNNLRRIGTSLHQYHDTHGSLPVAAVWVGKNLRTTMLNEVKQIDRVTYQNWAQLLLPHLGRNDVAGRFDPKQLVMADVNRGARLTRMPEFACGADPKWLAEAMQSTAVRIAIALAPSQRLILVSTAFSL